MFLCPSVMYKNLTFTLLNSHISPPKAHHFISNILQCCLFEGIIGCDNLPGFLSERIVTMFTNEPEPFPGDLVWSFTITYLSPLALNISCPSPHPRLSILLFSPPEIQGTMQAAHSDTQHLHYHSDTQAAPSNTQHLHYHSDTQADHQFSKLTQHKYSVSLFHGHILIVCLHLTFTKRRRERNHFNFTRTQSRWQVYTEIPAPKSHLLLDWKGLCQSQWGGDAGVGLGWAQ